METKNKNQEYYNELAVDKRCRHRDIVLDSHALSRQEAIITPFISHAKIKDNNSWLDIGCGRGYTARLADKLKFKYTGIDISNVNIKYCRNNYNNEFLCDDFLETPIEDKFQIITFFSSLHHFTDWKRVVKKAASLLTDEGFIYIEMEPTRFFAGMYYFWLKLKGSDIKTLKDIEIHWLKEPSILPEELPGNRTEYHFDFMPFFRRFSMRTGNNFLGSLYPYYRKVIYKKDFRKGWL